MINLTLESELKKENLRLASKDEAGYYFQTENDGKVWVTDLEE